MALPPEPLEEILPSAASVVVAEVTRVDELGAYSSARSGVDGAVDRPAQRVTLAVKRVLRGAAITDEGAGEVVVEKPAGGYALAAGTQGAFLVDASNRILGRYGPDTWAVDDVVRAVVGAP